jgi:hypothetical protein
MNKKPQIATLEDQRNQALARVYALLIALTELNAQSQDDGQPVPVETSVTSLVEEESG